MTRTSPCRIKVNYALRNNDHNTDVSEHKSHRDPPGSIRIGVLCMKSKVHLGNATERKRGDHRPQTAFAVAVELQHSSRVLTEHVGATTHGHLLPLHVGGTKDFVEIYVFAQSRLDATLNQTQRFEHGRRAIF